MCRDSQPAGILIHGLEASLFAATAAHLDPRVTVHLCSDAREMSALLASSNTAVVVLGVRDLAAEEALSVACRLRDSRPATRVIFVSGIRSESLVLAALRAGVAEYLTSPVTGMEIAEAIQRFVAPLPDDDGCAELVGTSKAMREVKSLIRRIAGMNSTVLITGETGTGKEVAARLIHRLSRRAEMPLVSLNCGAIPDTLLESEMFGYEKGAFTGAVGRHQGHFQMANGGTLFLDEIGDMSLSAQSKLLRALEQHEVHPLGGRPVPVDIRIIAATHHELENLVDEGRFRNDLFYRLHVARIMLPSLRERREDIPALARHLLREIAREHGRMIDGFTPSAMRRLAGHQWPGNVRQLRNVIEAAALMCDSRMIAEEDLRVVHCFRTSPRMPIGVTQHTPAVEMSVTSESDRLMRALEATNWNVTRAAELLCWSRVTVYRKVAKYQLERKTQAAAG
jgi:DNA-binding NtrC family response regulator